MVPEATSDTRRPALVDPVNDTMSTSGCAARASPKTGPRPLTRLKTPAGRPTDSSTSAKAKAKADSGATSEGFRTTVQPAARAAAIFATTWCSK